MENFVNLNVPFNSYHPSHVKTNIPYNLFRRIYLLVTDPKIINNRINELKFHLKGLKYPHSLIIDAINKAKGNNNTKLKNKPELIIPYAYNYNKQNFPFNSTIKNYFEMLKNNLSSKEIFKNYDLIIVHKKSLNIFQSINKSLPEF